MEHAQKDDVSTTKFPTEKGKYMGIAVDNKQAQQFIIDNMDAVVNSIGKKLKSRPWKLGLLLSLRESYNLCFMVFVGRLLF